MAAQNHMVCLSPAVGLSNEADVCMCNCVVCVEQGVWLTVHTNGEGVGVYTGMPGG